MNTSLLNLPKCIIIYLASFLKICDKACLKQICKRYNECITFSPIEIIHKYEGYISKLKNMNCKQCMHQTNCYSCEKVMCTECFNTKCRTCHRLVCENCLPKYKCNNCKSNYCEECITICSCTVFHW